MTTPRRLRWLLALSLAGCAASAGAGDTQDLLAAVRASREAQPPARPLEGWSVGKARTAAAGVVRRSTRAPGGWTDTEVLRAALLYSARGRAELSGRDVSVLWFDYARDMVASIGDRARRRQLQRDWALAVAALHSSGYDGRSARAVLDRATRTLADEPELLFATARLHEAIAARAFSGVALPVSANAKQAAQGDLAEALRLYERVLSLQPERLEARLRRGRVLSLLGRAGSAREEFEKVLAAAQDDGLRCLALLFEGVTREQDSELSAAADSYRRALTTGRSLAAARLALAGVLWSTGDRAGARQTMEELLTGGAPLSDAWWTYQSEGIGESSDHEARFAALWQEAQG